MLFEEPLEGHLLREIRELKASLERVRKSQFAKIGELQKAYDDLSMRFEILEKGTCKPVLHENHYKLFELTAES